MFLSSKEYRRRLRDIVLGSKQLKVAVAFWGTDGDELLRGRPGQERKVICNLRHGGTNPAVIKKLFKIAEVRQHDHLHAKVVLADDTAVIGSANISANGLGLEGVEVAGWEEAGLVTQDAGVLRGVETWFERLWDESQKISRRDLETAQARWALRQRDRAIVVPRKASRGPRRAPIDEAFEHRDVAIVVHRDFAGEEAEEAASALAKESAAGHRVRLTNLMWYEHWPWLPKTGAIISLIWRRSGRLQFNGAFEFLGQTSYRDGRLTVPVTVYRGIATVLGRRFDERAGHAFVRALKPRMRAVWRAGRGDSGGRLIPLSKALRKCPGAKALWSPA